MANSLTLFELFDGLQSRYPGVVAYPDSLDIALPASFVRAIAKFCRVPVARVQELDFRTRLPHLNRALLLQFTEKCDYSPRKKWQRFGYAFCPLCLGKQQAIHVPWEWCFACITRCSIHRTPLQIGCPNCGESDPLTFGPTQCDRACWSCGNDLSECANAHKVRADDETIRAVEDAYRAALLGVSSEPSLLGKVSHSAFREFVDDMLQLVVTSAHPKVIFPGAPHAPKHQLHQHRVEVLSLITDLIANAAPTSDERRRRFRQARSVKLWRTLFGLIPGYAGARLEEASRKWPLPLQRRFDTALRIQQQRNWPNSPFRCRDFSPGFKCINCMFVLDLSAANPQFLGKSWF